jgi:hypothetical protein
VAKHVEVEMEIIHFTCELRALNVAPVCCTLAVSGMTVTGVARQCLPTSGVVACYNSTSDGTQSSSCYCATDSCNNVLVSYGGAGAGTTQWVTTRKASSSGRAFASYLAVVATTLIAFLFVVLSL